MTPKRPLELVNASKACAEAWLKRDAMIDAGDTIGIQAMNEVCDMLEERHSALYRQWQDLGGTSDIETIALSRYDAESDGRNSAEDKQIEGYFGKVKVTTSADWRKRHLNGEASA